MLIPITLLVPHHEFADGKLFYLIKCYRLKQGLNVFDVQTWMKKLKDWKKAKLIKDCEEKPDIGEDIINDHNGITEIVQVNYCLRTFKLIIIIFNISYFLGMLWFIFADIVERSVIAYRDADPNTTCESKDVCKWTNP
jgi:hypothetical protein